MSKRSFLIYAYDQLGTLSDIVETPDFRTFYKLCQHRARLNNDPSYHTFKLVNTGVWEESTLV